jgi:hypothetical protein
VDPDASLAGHVVDGHADKLALGKGAIVVKNGCDVLVIAGKTPILDQR